MAKRKILFKKREYDSSFEVAQFIKSMNAIHGEGSLVLASDVNMNVEWVSTGCAAIDIVTRGGIPENRFTEVFGPESAGKTTLCLSTIAQFQEKYSDGVVGFVDVEKTFDPKYARNIGCDLSRIVLATPDSGEQGVDYVIELLTVGRPILIVIDSLAALVPMSESEAEADQQFVGLHPRLINRLTRVCISRMKSATSDQEVPSTTVIGVNQLREKVGVMFGNPETTPGGKGKNFFAGLRLRVSSSGASTNQIKDKDILYGTKHTAKVVKNKCGGTPFEDVAYEWYRKEYKGYLAWSHNNAKVVVSNAIALNLIPVVRGRYTLKFKTTKDISCKNETQLIKEFQLRPRLTKAYLAKIIRELQNT